MNKIFYSNIIPFKGFISINLFGFIFIRKEYKPLTEMVFEIVINHECIHTEQWKELLYVFFLPLYILNYIINLFIYFNFHKAYRNICFEREAYTNQYDFMYIGKRKRFSWWYYIIDRKNG